ncbi:IclR family transcriptional regulator [Xanthobacter autotrophicus]|uniref:IclR family transcriptional regulator n=1 Tax=Xanthobacter autotrophicus TaxID=280 RepID=UPI00372C426C
MDLMQVGPDQQPMVKPVPSRQAGAGIQSVERALTLLEAIANAGGVAGLNALAMEAGLNPSTCHHLLATLVQRGYVTKSAGRRYALGPRILSFSAACLRQVDLPRRAEPFLERINAATGETVHLAVLQGEDLFTIAKKDARHAVRVDSGAVGKTDAVHATATGKAILAWLPEPQIRAILAHKGMTRFTANTITDCEGLLEHLRAVRREGYATDNEEFQPHVVCVGAAIRDHVGTVVGSLSVSAPTMRADAAHLDLMRCEIVNAANSLSSELGNSGVSDEKAVPASSLKQA